MVQAFDVPSSYGNYDSQQNSFGKSINSTFLSHSYASFAKERHSHIEYHITQVTDYDSNNGARMYSFPPALPDMLGSTYGARSSSPPPTTTGNNHNPQSHAAQRLQRQEREEAKRAHARSPLALLAADEAAIAARKAAIRNFGAHWIRPPGITKTLQAMNEEEAERLEQEEVARQERGMADLEARQQFEELQARRQAGGEGEMGEERDLDEEVPDASDAGEDEEPDGDSNVGEESGIEITQGSVSFNEDSIVGGSRVEGGMIGEDEEVRYAQELEEAELTGAARDEEDLGIEHERNLDDSVPEAGSYQHTDTELEDDDEDSGLQDSFAGMRSTRRSGTQRSSMAARSARHSRSIASDVSQGLPATGASGSGGRTFDDHHMGQGSLQERMRAQAGAGESLPRSPGSLNLDSSLLGSSFMGSSPMMTRGAVGARGRAGAGRGRGGVGRARPN